ncbi:unnamed protein product, partial [Ixodes persulcatus]
MKGCFLGGAFCVGIALCHMGSSQRSFMQSVCSTRKTRKLRSKRLV